MKKIQNLKGKMRAFRRVAIMLGAVHAVDPREEAFARYRLPDSATSRFTANAFIEALLKHGSFGCRWAAGILALQRVRRACLEQHQV